MMATTTSSSSKVKPRDAVGNGNAEVFFMGCGSDGARWLRQGGPRTACAGTCDEEAHALLPCDEHGLAPSHSCPPLGRRIVHRPHAVGSTIVCPFEYGGLSPP